jgi:hypothetical protein
MSNHAKIVLWLGLFMIIFNIVLNWSQISNVLFGTGSGSPNQTANNNNNNAAARDAKNQGRPNPGSVQSRY